MAQRIVVTLIHGTFARGAAWAKDGSKLCNAIREAFPGEVEIRRLRWSGWNTIRARAHAAERLGGEIAAAPAPALDTKHFLVAHSHGGNIALYALHDPEVRERIAGVATLATPFLNARRRDLGAKGITLFCVGALLWAVLAGYLARRFLWPSAAFLDPVFVGVGLWFLFTWLVLHHWKRAGRVAEGLRLARPERERLWIARMSGDEASAALQTGQLIGTIVARVHLLFVRANAWAERTARESKRSPIVRIAGGLGVAFLFGGLVRSFGGDEAPSPILWGGITGIAIGTLIILWGMLPLIANTVVPIASGLVTPVALALPVLLTLPFRSPSTASCSR